MLVSILLPTRGRSEDENGMLIESVKSLVDTANSLDNFEILVRFDDDDIKSINFFKKYVSENFSEVDIKVSIGFRWGYNKHNRYYNELSEKAKGDMLWLWNDDIEMGSDDWDITLKEASDDGKRFVLFSQFCSTMIMMTFWWPGYSPFPIIPKRWFDTTKRWSSCWCCDIHPQAVAYSLDIHEILDVYIINNHHNQTGRMDFDLGGYPYEWHIPSQISLDKYDDNTYKETNEFVHSEHRRSNGIWGNMIPYIIEDIFILNKKFNLIDEPISGNICEKNWKNLAEFWSKYA